MHCILFWQVVYPQYITPIVILLCFQFSLPDLSSLEQCSDTNEDIAKKYVTLDKR